MGFSILKTRVAQETLGRMLAGYLRLVQRTNRITFEPADIYDQINAYAAGAPIHMINPEVWTG